MTKQDAKHRKVELWSLPNISREIEVSKHALENLFAKKIKIIEELIEQETLLVGTYNREMWMKDMLSETYNRNIVLYNAMANVTYRSLSMLLLIRNTFHGSAKALGRQYFENVVIAKFAERDPKLAERWEMQTDERDPSRDISMWFDVFKPLKDEGKRVDALLRTWNELCKFSHATKFSQQLPRIVRANSMKEIINMDNDSKFFQNTEYSLDLLMTLLAMNFHLLISYHGRKAYQWWFGYTNDPKSSYQKERESKHRCKKLFNDYFDNPPEWSRKAKELWKPVIFEFKRNWKPATTQQQQLGS